MKNLVAAITLIVFLFIAPSLASADFTHQQILDEKAKMLVEERKLLASTDKSAQALLDELHAIMQTVDNQLQLEEKKMDQAELEDASEKWGKLRNQKIPNFWRDRRIETLEKGLGNLDFTVDGSAAQTKLKELVTAAVRSAGSGGGLTAEQVEIIAKKAANESIGLYGGTAKDSRGEGALGAPAASGGTTTIDPAELARIEAASHDAVEINKKQERLAILMEMIRENRGRLNRLMEDLKRPSA